MRYLDSHFENPHFIENVLGRYISMLENRTSVYFEAEDLILLAEYFSGRENWERMAEVIDFGLKLHPDNIDLLLYKCQALIADQQEDDAARLLDTIPDANDFEVLLMRGKLAILQDMEYKAQEAFEQLYLQEETLTTLLAIVTTCIDCEEEVLARHWLESALEQYPDHREVLEVAADFDMTFGSEKDVRQKLQQLIDEYPYDIHYWIQMAESYCESGLYEKARETLEFALAIDEKSPRVLHLMGNCCMDMDDLPSAVVCFQRLEQTDADKTLAWLSLSHCYFLLQAYAPCIDYCTRLLQEKSLYMNKDEKAILHYRRGMSLMREDRMDEAQQEVELGRKTGSDFWGLDLMAGSLSLVTDPLPSARENAIRQIFKGVHRSKNRREALITALMTLFEGCAYPEAAILFERLELQGGDLLPVWYYLMAFCYFKLDNQRKFRRCLLKLSTEAPQLLAEDGLQLLDNPKFRNAVLAILQELKPDNPAANEEEAADPSD